MNMVSGAKAALTRIRTRSWEHRPDTTATDGVRVLLYHHVIENSGSLAVYPSEFRRQMGHLAKKGYHGIDVVTALDSLYNDRLEPKSIAITFDDGFTDVKDHALGVLAELGFSATVFVTIGATDGSLRYSWAPKDTTLTWEDICRLDAEGSFALCRTASRIWISHDSRKETARERSSVRSSRTSAVLPTCRRSETGP